jgi:hypothetical protein
MSGEHAKREMVTGEKPWSSGKKIEERTPSKEAGDKHKEESAGSIKSHRKDDKKKKKMKKVVYYETDSFHPQPLAPSPHFRSAKSIISIVRCLFAILASLNTLIYFPFP